MRLERTVAEVAALVGGRVEGPGDRRLSALLAPEHAGPDDLAPVFAGAPAALLAGCRAGSLLLGERTPLPAAPSGPGAPGGPPGSPPDSPPGSTVRSIIRVDDADLAVDRLVLQLVPAEEPPAPGVHPTALVAPGVELGEGVSVGPHAVLARGARVGPRTRLGAGVCLGADARVGADGVLHPYVVVAARCTLGDRVIVNAGAVIGSDGFGFRRDRQGRHTRIPQRGTVVIGNDVEIGAHTSIDRARFAVTRLGDGCKLDAHIHIGHNVDIGEHCAFAGQTGVAGSAAIGPRVLVGGHTGIRNGVRIGADSVVGGCTGVMQDVEPGSFVVGFPATAHRTWKRDALNVRRIGELLARVKALEAAAGITPDAAAARRGRDGGKGGDEGGDAP